MTHAGMPRRRAAEGRHHRRAGALLGRHRGSRGPHRGPAAGAGGRGRELHFRTRFIRPAGRPVVTSGKAGSSRSTTDGWGVPGRWSFLARACYRRAHLRPLAHPARRPRLPVWRGNRARHVRGHHPDRPPGGRQERGHRLSQEDPGRASGAGASTSASSRRSTTSPRLGDASRTTTSSRSTASRASTPTPDNYFKDHFVWNLLIEKMNLDFEKRLAADSEYTEHTTTIIEFARGGENALAEAFGYLSDEHPRARGHRVHRRLVRGVGAQEPAALPPRPGATASSTTRCPTRRWSTTTRSTTGTGSPKGQEGFIPVKTHSVPVRRAAATSPSRPTIRRSSVPRSRTCSVGCGGPGSPRPRKRSAVA